MKFVVLLGSPTGKDSLTRVYVRFIQQQFPDHTFEAIDIGRGTRRLERDRDRFDGIVKQMAEADGVIWTFPIYTMLAPVAVVRFIELLFERCGDNSPLAGQVSTVLTTSEHFFDHTAHLYMEEISEDLGMQVLKGFSAAMEDLQEEQGQRNLKGFVRQFLRATQERAALEIHHERVRWTPRAYEPQLGGDVPTGGGRRITLITDYQEGDGNLGPMIEAFVHHSRHPVDVLNLHEIDMKGGCMGCLKCVYDGTCVYKDGFAVNFDDRIRAADVLVFASTIRHRYLSSTFKAYFDRNFRNGHRPVLHGKPVGWLVSGPLRQLANLRQILEAVAEIQSSPRLGIITDEYESGAAITERIAAMARAVDHWDEEAWSRPSTFLGVGGRKIFRDLMWTVRGIVRADHAYYRREGLYDFPPWDWRRTLFNWAMATMMSLPWTRRWTLRKMGELKIAAFHKVVPPEG